MARFTVGNKMACNPKNKGRPRKLVRTIAEIFGPDELEALVRKAFEDAMVRDGPSRAWLLSQMPKIDNGQRLLRGLPKLDDFAGCIAAIDAVAEDARLGNISIAEAERAATLLATLAGARTSTLAKYADRLDEETRELIERERKLMKRLDKAATH